MRIILFALLSFLSCSAPLQNFSSFDASKIILGPCPSSPNCISSTAIKRKKRMEPLTFKSEISVALSRLDSIVQSFSGVNRLQQTDQYLHYTFKTKFGGFTDDVEFLADKELKLIHFRSASRKGWSDAGANRRRMRRIIKAWNIRD